MSILNKHCIFKFIGITVVVFLIVCGMTLVVFNHIGFPVEVSGSSMFPTYNNGDLLWVDKITDPDNYETGDIVVFEGWDGTIMIKRIIGTPGDVISLYGQVVYVNGTQLDEPYIVTPIHYDTIDEKTIPSGSFWVMGDNRNNSLDSRMRGVISKSDILGRVVTSKKG